MSSLSGVERHGWLGFLIWSAAVVALMALPVLVFTTRGHTGTQEDSLAASRPSPRPRPTPTPSPVPTGGNVPLTVTPLCADVWQRAKRVPSDYAGCQSSGVVYPAGIVDGCLATWDDRWWARLGGAAHETGGDLEQNAGYERALSTLCP